MEDQETPQEPIENNNESDTKSTQKETLKNNSSKDTDLKKSEDNCNECFWDKYKWVILVLLLLAIGYFVYIYFFQDNSFRGSSEFGSINIKPSEPFYDSKPSVVSESLGTKRSGAI